MLHWPHPSVPCGCSYAAPTHGCTTCPCKCPPHCCAPQMLLHYPPPCHMPLWAPPTPYCCAVQAQFPPDKFPPSSQCGSRLALSSLFCCTAPSPGAKAGRSSWKRVREAWKLQLLLQPGRYGNACQVRAWRPHINPHGVQGAYGSPVGQP